jgi:branched-chain amino acid transport system substrate-binding protein
MKFTKRSFILLFVCCGLSACSSKEIKIGVVLPLSGQSSSRGEDMLNAAVLAVEERNQQGGIKGKHISLHIEDDRDDPEKALAASENLIHSDVLAVIGHYSSTATQATLPHYVEAGLSLISPAVALTHIPGEGIGFFRTLNTNQKQAVAASQWIRQAGYQQVAIVHNTSTYGRDLAQQMLIALRHSPQKEVPQHITVLEDDGSMAAIESFQKDIPELVFYAGGYQAAAHFLNTLFSRGIAVDWMGGRTLWEHDFIRLLGAEQARTGWVMATPITPQVMAFNDLYSQRFGRPGPFAYSTYMALQALFQSLEQQPKKITRESVGKALQAHFKNYAPPALSVFSLKDEESFDPAVLTAPVATSAGQKMGRLLAIPKAPTEKPQ